MKYISLLEILSGVKLGPGRAAGILLLPPAATPPSQLLTSAVQGAPAATHSPAKRKHRVRQVPFTFVNTSVNKYDKNMANYKTKA